MQKLLEIISTLDCVYSAKVGFKHCGDVNCPHIIDAVAQGFISEEVKDPANPYKGVRITDAGKTELARLLAIPPAPRVLTAKEIRMNELRAKFVDATATHDEVVEFLKLYHT